MEKLIKDRLVAVVISPCYGTRWSTCNGEDNKEVLLFDKDIATAVLNGDMKKAESLGKLKTGSKFLRADCLTVEWLQIGTPFTVTVFDGGECIVTPEELEYTA